MGHEITTTDNVVLAREPAWHRLGIVWPKGFGPREGLRIGGLDWDLDERDLFTFVNGEKIHVDTHKGMYRADNGDLLGIVSNGYAGVSNLALAEFCCQLANESHGELLCETIGSIMGGKRVWILMHGKHFDIGGAGDTVHPYLLASNTHDGSGSLRLTPTSVRTVCSNTLHMVVPRADTGQLASAAWVFRHTSSIHDRIEAAKKALKAFATTKADNAAKFEALRDRKVDEQIAQDFFYQRYAADFNPVPVVAADIADERKIKRALSAYDSFLRRWDDEATVAGGRNLWSMLNAYTGMVQHDQKARGADDVARVERRIESNLFGLNTRRTDAAYAMVLDMAKTRADAGPALAI